MAYEIVMTRGTTSLQQFVILMDGQPYMLEDYEYIRFGVKESHNATRMLINRTFTKNDQDQDGAILFSINPQDTINWPCKIYKYDIGLQSKTDYYIVIPESDFIVQPNITSYEVVK